MTDTAIVARLNAQMHAVMQPITSPAEVDPLVFTRADGEARRLPHHFGACQECAEPELSLWEAVARVVRRWGG